MADDVLDVQPPIDEPIVDEDPPIDEPTITDDEKHEILIMRHAYQKLDGLPLGFGLPEYSEDISDEMVKKYFSLDFYDTMREMQTDISIIQEGSLDEMIIENRVVYHALKRFRFTASTFFKFSTATDGKTIDKTNIPRMLKQLIDEYDAEFKEWRSKGTGNIWNRTATLKYSNT